MNSDPEQRRVLEHALELHKQKLRERYSGTLTIFRSTLTANSANQILPYFELGMSTGDDINIPYEDFLLSPDTVYKKVADAFRWFILYDDTIDQKKKQQIAAYKARTRIVRGENAIRIINRAGTRDPRSSNARAALKAATSAAVTQVQAENLEWKQQYMDWIETLGSETGTKMFRRTGLLLTPEDIELVRALADGVGAVANVTGTEITVVRD